MGVYSELLLEPIAETLRELGLQKAWSFMAVGWMKSRSMVKHRWPKFMVNIFVTTLTPADFGLKYYTLEAIRGGDPDENRQITEKLISR